MDVDEDEEEEDEEEYHYVYEDEEMDKEEEEVKKESNKMSDSLDEDKTLQEVKGLYEFFSNVTSFLHRSSLLFGPLCHHVSFVDVCKSVLHFMGDY